MLDLYRNIKELRKLNHWTQEELAKKMGYTDRSSIAKIESGKVDLPRSKILEFAKVFGVDAGDLMGNDGTSRTEDAYLSLLSAYEEQFKMRELINLYKNAIPEAQKVAILILQSGQIEDK